MEIHPLTGEDGAVARPRRVPGLANTEFSTFFKRTNAFVFDFLTFDGGAAAEGRPALYFHGFALNDIGGTTPALKRSGASFHTGVRETIIPIKDDATAAPAKCPQVPHRSCYYSWVFSSGRGSAWLEHLVRDQGVGGSNPLAPINPTNDLA